MKIRAAQLKNQRGLAFVLEIVLVALVLTVAGFVGWRVYKAKRPLPQKDAAGNVVTYDQAASRQLTSGKCSGAGSTTIVPPMPLAQTGSIQPYGLMVGGHVTPIDHQYYIGLDGRAPRDTYDVVAPADGHIVDIQHRGDKVNTPPHTTDVPSSDEYRMVIAHSCSFLTYVDLVTSLDDSIKAKLPPGFDPKNIRDVDIPVKQGQVIGHIGGQTLDFAVWDLSQKPLGFIVPEAYDAEAWKIWTAPTTKYLDPKVKDQVIAKYLRTAEPIDGKIDYDQDGKLVGTWFQDGTKGYGGGSAHGGMAGYWAGHLSFAPNYLDPTKWVISMGNYPGQLSTSNGNGGGGNGGTNPQQFGIKGNGPDPTTISTGTGVVKYELVQQNLTLPNGQHFSGEFARGITAQNSDQVLGTVLVQLTDSRKLKFEVFPNKTAAQVSGFDGSALTYTRGEASQ